MLKGLVTVAIGGMIAALTLGPATAANATLGSVPTEVSSYVSSGQLLARLIDIYGKNASGTAGLPFGDTTTVGAITRVYEWTTDRLANQATDHPVQLTNNWVVPISIGDKPVGVATIWINPQTVLPELAEFDQDTALAIALPTLPAYAALVRDPVSHAWLALADGTVTALVAGSSGLTTPAPVASLKLAASPAPTESPGHPQTGLALAIGIVAVVVLVLVIALWVSLRRRPPRSSAAVEPVEPEVAPVEEVAPAEEVALPEELAPVEDVTPLDRPVRKSRAASDTKPTSPVTKPASSKPSSRATGGPTASTKPRIQKPPTQKPPTQKPPRQEPPESDF